MTCNRFFNFNLVDQDTTEITADSENAFFPASNIKDTRTTKVFRSLDGVLSASLVFDFKTTETIDSVLVVADSSKGFGFTSMLIEGNTTSNFTSPIYSGVLTPDFLIGFGYLDLKNDPQNLRFWRVTITGGSPYLELSKLFIGQEIGLDRSINLNWSKQNRDLSSRSTNRYGQAFIDKITNQKDIRVGFSNLTVDQNELLSDVMDINGKHTPIWIILDAESAFSTKQGSLAGQFHFADVPQFNNPFYRRFGTNIRLIEAN